MWWASWCRPLLLAQNLALTEHVNHIFDVRSSMDGALAFGKENVDSMQIDGTSQSAGAPVGKPQQALSSAQVQRKLDDVPCA